jgi:hypothetical protein
MSLKLRRYCECPIHYTLYLVRLDPVSKTSVRLDRHTLNRRSCSAIGQLTPRKEAGHVTHLNLDYL